VVLERDMKDVAAGLGELGSNGNVKKAVERSTWTHFM